MTVKVAAEISKEDVVEAISQWIAKNTEIAKLASAQPSLEVHIVWTAGSVNVKVK